MDRWLLRPREFIVLLGAAAVLHPRVTAAQRMRHLGALMGWPENDPDTRNYVTAFARALKRDGWIDSRNIRIDWRFSPGNPALFRKYAAAELTAMRPDAMLASTTPALVALSHLTRTIPIVFVQVSDPVGQGFVASLARPGGNLTGFSAYDEGLAAKWVQLLKEVAPGVSRIAVVFNPKTAPYARLLNPWVETVASSFRIAVTLAPVEDDAAIERAVAVAAGAPGGSLLSLPDSFTAAHHDAIIVASRHRLPLTGVDDVFARAGP